MLVLLLSTTFFLLLYLLNMKIINSPPWKKTFELINMTYTRICDVAF